jgi:hypothetical protein
MAITSDNNVSTTDTKPKNEAAAFEVEDGKQEQDLSEHDERTQALIQAAARAIVDTIEHEDHSEATDFGAASENDFDNDYRRRSDTAFTDSSYDDNSEYTENQYGREVNEEAYDGSGSSHHEDDVFSHGRRSSDDGSLSSNSGQHTDKEARYNSPSKERTYEDNTPRAGLQEAEVAKLQRELDDRFDGGNDFNAMSRIPSVSSNTYSLLPTALALASPRNSQGRHTPSRSGKRVPFRSPSSVRAIQMSSPAPSIFSGCTPASRKRSLMSHMGGSQSNFTVTPTKPKTPSKVFKAKQEQPLVLLHVTLLPLHWQYAEIMEDAPSEALSEDLQKLRETWRLLQQKLGDTVFERGVLLPHPQDSYETLEERLLGSLDLPIRPRARILSCGHYVGPNSDFIDDVEPSSAETSDSEDMGADDEVPQQLLWCDVCCRDVKFEKYGTVTGRRKKNFRVKVYASNGLMGASTWETCWREMERVDVEIEPAVEASVIKQLNQLIEDMRAVHSHEARAAEERLQSQQAEAIQEQQHMPQAEVLQTRDAAHSRQGQYQDSKIVEVVTPSPIIQETLTKAMVSVDEGARRAQNEDMLRQQREEERLREIYGMNEQEYELSSTRPVSTVGIEPTEPQHTHRHEKRSSARAAQNHDDDSFVELLLAAIKVLLQDKKNIVIGFLSVLLILFAVRAPGPITPETGSWQSSARDAHVELHRDHGHIPQPQLQAIVVAQSDPVQPDIATPAIEIRSESVATLETPSEAQSSSSVPTPEQATAAVASESEAADPKTIETVLPAKQPLDKSDVDRAQTFEHAEDPLSAAILEAYDAREQQSQKA